MLARELPAVSVTVLLSTVSVNVPSALLFPCTTTVYCADDTTVTEDTTMLELDDVSCSAEEEKLDTSSEKVNVIVMEEADVGLVDAEERLSVGAV